MDASRMLDALLAAMRARGSLAVGFSGGVDSAVVAAAAQRALGDRAVAVTVDSPSLARRELQAAVDLAGRLGLRHVIVASDEVSRPEYAANPVDRCYFCRQDMSAAVWRAAEGLGFAHAAMGVNASDLGEWRPGHRAMEEARVWQPLLELGVDKDGVRALARLLDLPVAEKPSMACLSSRIPHGEAITVGKLRRIEAAEDLLRDRGYRQVRVRSLGDLARIEVGADEVARLQAELPQLSVGILALGYARVEADPRGYRTGSLTLLPRPPA